VRKKSMGESPDASSLDLAMSDQSVVRRNLGHADSLNRFS
jgi:hypothetical protein